MTTSINLYHQQQYNLFTSFLSQSPLTSPLINYNNNNYNNNNYHNYILPPLQLYITDMSKISNQWNKVKGLAQSIVNYSNHCIDDPSKTDYYLDRAQSLAQQIIQLLKLFSNVTFDDDQDEDDEDLQNRQKVEKLSGTIGKFDNNNTDSSIAPATKESKSFKRQRYTPIQTGVSPPLDYTFPSSGEKSTSSSSPITSPIPSPFLSPIPTTTTTTTANTITPRCSNPTSPMSSDYIYSTSDSEGSASLLSPISPISPISRTASGKLLPKKRGRPNQKKPEKCFSCGSTTTPEWRKGREGVDLCNACGLKYIKINKKELESKNKHSINNVLNHPDKQESDMEILETQRQIIALQKLQKQTHSQLISKQSASNNNNNNNQLPNPPPTLKNRITKSQPRSKK